ncbi:hypothetical protein ACFTXM_44905 [Streptomyces sp. NPDC056930]|uniref:hypothetical protein n=1 Tax=Streptomyces sp. NPDC056930 TaxID=3345967 RepID=UPI0036455F43
MRSGRATSGTPPESPSPDSKLFGAGGGWIFQLTPEGDGTRIDVELTRKPSALKGKILASLLPLVAPSSLRKSFAGPLKAAE